MKEYLPRLARDIWKAIFLISLPVFALCGFSHPSKNQKLLKRIREAYYNPLKHGLKGMGATVHPQWISMPAGTSVGKLDSVNAVLRQIHFWMSIDSNSEIAITHEDDSTTTYDGFVQDAVKVLAGIFQTWKGFVLSTPFDGPDSMYAFTKSGKEYELTAREQNDTSTITLSSDFWLRKLTMKGNPMHRAEVTPHFMKTAQGLLYTGIDATFDAYGDMPSIPSATVSFTYERYLSFWLPKTIQISSTLQNMRGVILWTLDGYWVLS